VDQDKGSLSQITAKYEIIKKKSSTDDAPVCETKQRKLECACSGLVLHKINDYLYHIYEQMINAIIDEVNDGFKETKIISLLQ
jgi:hypothetical protein